MMFPEWSPARSVTLNQARGPFIGDREARLLDAVDRVRSIKKTAASEAASATARLGVPFNT